MKKWISLPLAVIILALLVSACGGGNNNGNSAGTAGETEKPTADEGTKANASGEKATIKIIGIGVEIADQLKAMTEDYMKENPNITVQLEIPNDNTLLKTRFASGDAPDLFVVASNSDIASWSQYLADLSDEPWMSKVSPIAVPGMTVDGKKLGFPVTIAGYGFIYNKDLFAKAGIDQVPTTLTELKQVNEKLKAAGIQSYNEPYKEWWPLGQHLFNLPFAYEKDPVSSVNKINSGEMKVKDLANMNGFFDVLDMTLDYGKGKESIGIAYNDELSAFATGKVAMIQQGSWVFDPIEKITPNMNMGMFAIPLSDNSSDTKLPVDCPNYYVVNKNSPYMEQSKQFLTWLHDNGQKYIVDSFKYIPPFTDLQATDALGPIAGAVFDYSQKNTTIPWSFTLWPTGTNQEFAKPLQAYIGGVSSKEQALDEIQEIWNSHLKA